MDEFNKRCAKIAERFLLTAVIVDDEAQIPASPRPTESLRTPDRYTTGNAPEETRGNGEATANSLDARTLVDTFAKHGLICAVIVPPRDDSAAADIVMPVARRADIVILDWRLHQDDGNTTIRLLTDLLSDGEATRLRLIAIYTGRYNLIEIGATVRKNLKQQGWDFQSNGRGVQLSYGHCRIVIYAKAGTQLEAKLKDRAIAEGDVPSRLIGDFADMTRGLLPGIALTSLSAVRENSHKVLNSFSSELDPALLAHRACLPIPDNSQQHIVNLLDSELHAIVDDAVMDLNPAGFDSVRDWLDSNFCKETSFRFGTKELPFQDVVDLLRKGLHQSPLGRKDYKHLSSGFVKNRGGSEDLDHQLAWMFNFRTVSNSPPPILQLGTALEKRNREDGNALYLCMRPRCDSLRLQNAETFLLLPLIDPVRGTIQLVLKTDKGEYLRRSLCTSPSQWLLVEFAPDDSKRCVVAVKGADGQFSFTSTNGTRFNWIGELKAEFAQRVAQHFASGLSRVATDNSEWLRRHEG